MVVMRWRFQVPGRLGLPAAAVEEPAEALDRVL